MIWEHVEGRNLSIFRIHPDSNLNVFSYFTSGELASNVMKMDQDPRAAWHSFWLSCWEDNFQAYFTLMLVDTSSHNKLIKGNSKVLWSCSKSLFTEQCSVDLKKIEIEKPANKIIIMRAFVSFLGANQYENRGVWEKRFSFVTFYKCFLALFLAFPFSYLIAYKG